MILTAIKAAYGKSSFATWYNAMQAFLAVKLISILLQGMKYTALMTSLLAQSDLTVQQVEDALKNEEAHTTGVAAAAAAAAMPPAAAPTSTYSHRSKKPRPTCAFCGRPGHVAKKCFKLEAASKKAKEEVSNDTSKSRSDGKANVADSTTPMGSAGAASVHSSSSPSSLPDAWNADTGATSHMTPHCRWFKSYAPYAGARH